MWPYAFKKAISWIHRQLKKNFFNHEEHEGHEGFFFQISFFSSFSSSCPSCPSWLNRFGGESRICQVVVLFTAIVYNFKFIIYRL